MGVRFPDGFLWGAATASYQIEGAIEADGRQPSIWDTFSHTPGRTMNGDNGDIASAHYGHLDEDLDLMAGLGLSAYRFSVAWPRVQPYGKGPANQAGLDFYRRLVDGLRQRGILPVATLYHWDLPQALEDTGGWTVRDTSERFGEYTSIVVEALGDSVGMWSTLNEPWCSVWLGYGKAEHAPGYADVSMALHANHYILLAHSRALSALREATRAPVGITLNLTCYVPATDHPLDIAAARRGDGFQNRLFLDPVLKGEYPADMVEHFSRHKPGLEGVVAPGDMEEISRPLDFLGINYYSTNAVVDFSRLDDAKQAGYVVASPSTAGAGGDLRVAQVGRPYIPRTGAGWEVDPGGLTELLLRVREEYADLPIYIHENGSAERDYLDPNGDVHDPKRVEYLDRHLRVLHAAMEKGVDVRGYFVWSLLDNFEWAHGFSMRFGLIWVDYPTGKRVPKGSYHWYRQVIGSNALP